MPYILLKAVRLRSSRRANILLAGTIHWHIFVMLEFDARGPVKDAALQAAQ